MKTGWGTRTLGDLCTFENGDRGENYPSKSVQTTSGVPFINAGHLTEAGIDFSGMTYIPRERFELLGNGKIRKNDILFCLRGSLGKFACVGDLNEGAIASSLIIIRPNEQILNKFLCAYLQSGNCAEMIREFRNGAAQPNLAAASLKKFVIPIPPLPEQQRIVGILDEAFAGLATAEANAARNLQNAREIFDSHLHAVFSQRGEGWVERRLDDICEISSALVDPRESSLCKLTHVGAGNIQSQTGCLVDLKTAEEEGLISGKFLFDDSAVLYSKIRPYLMKVARPTFRGLCSADMYPLSPNPGMVNRDFLFYTLLTKHFTEYAVAGSARAGMPKVNRDHLFAYKVFLPPVGVQAALARVLDSLREQVNSLSGMYEQKQSALTELKKSLLHEAFSGKL